MQRVANIPRFALHVHNASRRNRGQTDPHLCTKPPNSRIDALVDCLIDGIEMNYSTHEAWRKVATEILALNGNDRVPDESKGLPEEDWRPE